MEISKKSKFGRKNIKNMIVEFITATVIVCGVKKIYDWRNTKKLGILGMPESGKTLFLRKIANKDNVTKGKTKHKGIKYRFKYNDFSGDYFDDQYKDITKECDFNIFMFDISKYIGDKKNYKIKTDARLLKLTECDDFVKKKYAIIGTHLDKCSPSEKAPIQKEVLSILPDNIKKLF